MKIAFFMLCWLFLMLSEVQLMLEKKPKQEEQLAPKANKARVLVNVLVMELVLWGWFWVHITDAEATKDHDHMVQVGSGKSCARDLNDAAKFELIQLLIQPMFIMGVCMAPTWWIHDEEMNNTDEEMSY